MFELDTPLREAPMVYVDVETTGLSVARGDRICEVAALRVEGGEVRDAYQHLIDPQHAMSAGARAVHGISDAMLDGAPTFKQVVGDMIDLLEGAVFVGHNAPFDLDFVSSEVRRSGHDMPPTVALDTLRLSRRTFRAKSYALGALARGLQVEVSGRAHRAMVDVLLTRGVMERIIEAQSQEGCTTVGDYMRLQGGALRWGGLAPFDVPPIIRDALDSQGFLYIRYRSETGQETERLVRPLGVSERNGQVLLLTHCLLRDAQRTFRLDRIVDVEMVASFD